MRVEWVLLDRERQAALKAGDLVSVEAGGAPTWRVVRLDAERAWLRDEMRQMDCVSSLAQFQWKAEMSDA